MKFYYDIINNSNEMLEATLKKNTKKICNLLEEAHLTKIIKPRDKMDHVNLKRVIKFAYFNATMTYSVGEEVENRFHILTKKCK